MDNDIKVKNMLKLAGSILSIFHDFLDSLLSRKENSLVAKMHIGFGNKMFSTFESLVADASVGRAEAIHHLKTLVESYIYVRWMGQEDKNARLVYAKMCYEKKKFFEKNPGYIPKEESGVWERTLSDSVKGMKSEWEVFRAKSLEMLSSECELVEVYTRIYKLACEPAHISDLLEFIPENGSSIGLDRTSMNWAFVALDYGCFVVISALADCDNLYELNKADEIRIVKAEYESLRMQ